MSLTLGMSMSPPRPVVAIENCASCRGAVALTCEGISGYAGYRTFNEYLCPHCQKLNHTLTFGAIVSARAAHALESAS